ncbi:YdcF family protein [Desulfuribacillus alkaliarsenatis]|uniref:YdcF family protein n=1 Tax=Desulfuribacillus alkaliarsenatis TaxID=766136 RepID=UPI00159F168F|nr:YdcF family protein [Desulfuribacillus alkaliarsenatis]
MHLLIQSAIVDESDIETSYVVILGAGLRENQPSLSLRYRLQSGLKYLEQYPDSKVIVTGGLGAGEAYTEAEIMKKFLVERGIDKQRIIKEEQATNTFENLLFSKEIILEAQTLEEKTLDDKTLEEQTLEEQLDGEAIKLMIVTSDFHLYRAKLIAKRLGFEPYGIPAKTPQVATVRLMVREYFAIIKTYIFDRIV